MSMISYLEVSGLNTVQFGSENLSGLITETFSGSKATRRLNRIIIYSKEEQNSFNFCKDCVDLRPTVVNPPVWNPHGDDRIPYPR